MSGPACGKSILFRIPGDARYVPVVRKGVGSIARSLGFPQEVIDDIELSVSEALSNAVEHGSPKRDQNAVVVLCKLADDALTVDVRDEGPGFDCDAPRTDPPDVFSEGGRGLPLIYRLMDKVNVSHTGRGARVRMVKRNSEAGEPVARR